MIKDLKSFFFIIYLHYIRVKNFIHSFIVQSSDIKGFLEFQYFFRRQHMIFDIQPNMFKNIFDRFPEIENIKLKINKPAAPVRHHFEKCGVEVKISREEFYRL